MAFATPHPLRALKDAIRAAVAADAGLSAYLAGNTVLDDMPRGEPAPVAVFAEAGVKDVSTAEGRACEITLAIALRARPGESAGALDAAAALDTLLTDAALPLAGWRLVSLAATETQQRRGNDREPFRAVLRLRAAIEAAPA